jgi:hypothetical protein
MDFAVVFTREEMQACIFPKDQDYIYYADIDNIAYFVRVYKDTLEKVPIKNITGGLFVYIENGKVELVPPPPKLMRS